MIKAFFQIVLILCFIGEVLNGQCNISVNAGPDLKVCNIGDIITINGKVTGAVTEIFWDPATGLSNPKSPITKATVFGPQEYILTARGLSSQNLIVNGNFEAGNTGFTTDYVLGTNSCYGLGYLDCEGTYGVITNPQFGHAGFAPCGDHTSGGGLMMVLNGSAAFQNVWCQDVTVIPDMDYVFTAWVTSVVSASPAVLQFSINGNPIGPNFNSSGSTCLWEKYEVTWNSGGNTVAQICILNENTQTGGNDFAIDDLGFKKICEVKDTMKIEVEEIIVEIEEPELITCDNPMIKLNAKASSKGTGWTYQWTTSNGKIISGANSLEPTIKGPGTYYLTVCSPLPNCCLTKSIEVQGNIIPPDLLLISKDTLGCNNLSATILSRSLVSPLTYQWSGPNGFNSNDPLVVVLEAGKYILTITDEYNCKTIDSVNVFEIIDNPKISIQSNPINCKVDTARLIGSSSVAGSKFEWSGPNNTNFSKSEWNVVDTGIYILKVTSPSGCIKYDTVLLKKDQNLPIVNYQLDTITCLQDSSTIIVTTNRKIVNAQWQSSSWFYSLDTLSIKTGSAGVYELKVEADNGCITLLNIPVLADTIHPNLTASNDTISCLKTSIPLNSSNLDPTVNIRWYGPNGFVELKDSVYSNQAGKYQVIGLAKNGCSDTVQIELFVDTLKPDIKLLDDTLNCIKKSTVLKLSDSLTSIYSWSGPNNFSSSQKNPFVSKDGNYTVTASLPNGCSTTQILNIYLDVMLPILSTTNDTLTCKKDSIQLKATNDNANAAIQWKGPNGFNSILLNPYTSNPGNYNLVVTNPNGCSDSLTVTIFQDIGKPDLISNNDTLNCTKRTANLFAISSRDSLLFDWTGPAGFQSNNQNISVNTAGIYTIRISTFENCYSILNVEVLEDTLKPVLNLIIDTLNCLKTQTNLNFTTSDSLVSYKWTGPSNFSSNQKFPTITQGGKYNIIVVSPNTCSDVFVVDILQDTIKPLVQYTFDSINCFDREVELKATIVPANLIGEWTLNNQQKYKSNSILTKAGGTFTFDVINSNFCANSISFFVPVDTLTPDLTSNNDTINCNFPSVNLSAKSNTPGVQYQWKGPGTITSTQSNLLTLIPGTYTISIIASNGCINQKQSIVFIDTLKPSILTASDSIDCIHSEATLLATTNITNGIFRWTNNQNQILSTNALLKTKKGGAYFIEILNPSNGCISRKNQIVSEDSLIIKDVLIETIHPKCGAKTGSASVLEIIGGHQNIQFSIDQKRNYTKNPNFNPLLSGLYTLYVIDENKCEFQKDFEIVDLPFIDTDLAPEIAIGLGDSIRLDLTILPNRNLIKSIQWNPILNLSCNQCEDPFANPPETAIYNVTVIDTNGCISTKRIRIVVETPKVWVPNVFSPNGDNINDILWIHGSKEDVTRIHNFQIFDRWGNRVFETRNFQPNDQSKAWNGTFKDQKCNPGVYIYWAEVELINGQKWIIKGDITLIR
ncbi:MAG: gliding motility-associated C-terminal domain-containing protein [Saprospiraceae bacterium]|nr:gliding motility-associated C-terminal domain-containing protein [Saprospiraceae bacterium]